VRYGISVPNFAEPGQLLEVARAADTSGWDGFFLWDHIVVDREAPPPISEPWTVLAAAAMVTARVRLGTMVTPVARRRPWVLARQVTTVDHLSGGRAVLGVGLGVPPDAEYATFDESSEPRRHAELLDEGLDMVDALWSGEPAHHSGVHYDMKGVRFLPRPVQHPRVPVWSAASLPARGGVHRAARWDGVVPMFADGRDLRPASPAEIADVVRDVDGRRDRSAPFDVVVWAIAPDADVRRQYEQAGATWLIEGPAPGPDWLDDAMTIAHEEPPAS
jgi:alkanesulfonate monooxygenase SsuD/methylene tetrahydromethanopterin reductase-like flavin-dependent oxidoreductase (luciferase family)